MTKRQIEIVRIYIAGAQLKDVAAILNIKVGSVKESLGRTYKELGFKGKKRLMQYCSTHTLVAITARTGRKPKAKKVRATDAEVKAFKDSCMIPKLFRGI